MEEEMANNLYVDRIVEAAGINESQATRALLAVFQGLLDTIGEKSHTSINITPTPDCDSQVIISINIVVNNPTGPH
jgi:hypothetical protein